MMTKFMTIDSVSCVVVDLAAFVYPKRLDRKSVVLSSSCVGTYVAEASEGMCAVVEDRSSCHDAHGR